MIIKIEKDIHRRLVKTKIALTTIFSAGVVMSCFTPLFIVQPIPTPTPDPVDPEPFEANEIPKDWLSHDPDYTTVFGLVDPKADYSPYDTLRIPATVTTIKGSAFSNAFSALKNPTITKVIFGNMVSIIGTDSFIGWDTLQSITVDPSNTEFSVSTNNSNATTLGQFLVPTNGLDQNFKTGGLAWGEIKFTFNNMAPGNTTIGDFCFEGATGVTTVDFSNITSLGQSSFANLPKLTEIDLKKVANISDSCFENDQNVSLLSGNYATAPTLGQDVFKNLKVEGRIENAEAVGNISSEELCNIFLQNSLSDHWSYSNGWISYSLLDIDGTTVKGIKSGSDISSFTALKIYNGITTVDNAAFGNTFNSVDTPKITSLIVGDDVDSINTDSTASVFSFSGWDNLAKISVSSKNKTYKIKSTDDGKNQILYPNAGLAMDTMVIPVAHGDIVIDYTMLKSTSFNNPIGKCSAITSIEFGLGIDTVGCSIADNKNLSRITFSDSVNVLNKDFVLKNLPNLDIVTFNSFPRIVGSIGGEGCPKIRAIMWNKSNDIGSSWASTSFSNITNTGIMIYENSAIDFSKINSKFRSAGLDTKWNIFNANISGPTEIINTPYYGNGNDFIANSSFPDGVWKVETDIATKSIIMDVNDNKCCVITDGQYVLPDDFELEISYQINITGYDDLIKNPKIIHTITVKSNPIPTVFPCIVFGYNATTEQYEINGEIWNKDDPTTEPWKIETIICPDYYDDGVNGLKKIACARSGLHGTTQMGWSNYPKIKSVKFGRYMSDRLNASANYDGGNLNLFMLTPKIEFIYIPEGIKGYTETFYNSPKLDYSSLPNDWSKRFYRLWKFNKNDSDSKANVPWNVYSATALTGTGALWTRNKTEITFGSELEGSLLTYLPASLFSSEASLPNLVTLTCWATNPPEFVYSDAANISLLFMNMPNLASIRVPAESVEFYQWATGWKNAADKIIGI